MIKRLIKFNIINKQTIKIFILPIFLSLISVFTTTLIPLYFKKIIDYVQINKRLSLNLIIWILFLIILDLTLQIISSYLLRKIGVKIVYNLRVKVSEKILNLKKHILDQYNHADLANILSNDTAAIFLLISNSIPELITSILGIIVIGIVLINLSLQLSICLIITVPLILLIYSLLGKKLATISLNTQNELGNLNSQSVFITSNNTFIKANSTQYNELNKTKMILKKLKKLGIRQAKINALITPILSIILFLTVICVVTYGIYLVSIKTLSIGSLIAYLSLVFQIMSPILTLGATYSDIKSIQGAMERIFLLFDKNIENNKNDEIILNPTSITFENVSFWYPNEKNKIILENINFSIKTGETIALVGPSGAGKTTLFYLIEKFYSVPKGNILIDQKNINDVPINILRKNIGYVSQTFPLLSDTIKNNLIYGNKESISNTEILEAIKEVNLYNDLKKFNHGIDTHIGINSENLSEGQKQRLEIAKILLQKSPILLLDEITSSVDALSEEKIVQALNKIKHNKIIFMIAHRLSTVKNADRIIFLEEGKITGVGKHKELYNTHKLYASFVDTQLKN
ncbi:ABC transporter ATP-binding protein [Enterococcus faecium]|nr:ABC transporter ATP-binding protein [Enterococcus faecium]